jgi:predicted DNA-binding protein (UPF0251 family)
MPEEMEVRLALVPKHVATAAKVAELEATGLSNLAIATIVGTTWRTVQGASEYSKTSEFSPARRLTACTISPNSEPPAYLLISEEVARMSDRESMSFVRIAGRLGVSMNTVRRAYDWAHRAEITEAAARGETLKRGRRGQAREGA